MGETTELEVYGEREVVREMGARIEKFQKPVKQGMELTAEDAQRAAQYALAVDANPFRGEIYAFKNHKGDMLIVEGYKLLVRWARRQCPYSEQYTVLKDEEKPGGSIGWRCWILREDSMDMLKQLKQAGASFREAFEIVATDAVGVVTKGDMAGRNQAPKGWTWDQVAKKRALKNALNKSHGAPSPREIAQQSWEVGTTQTEREDWVPVEALPSSVIERAAAASAQARERVYAEHERDTALPTQPPTRGRAMLFKTTDAEPMPARAVDQGTEAVVEGQAEEVPAEGPVWPQVLDRPDGDDAPVVEIVDPALKEALEYVTAKGTKLSTLNYDDLQRMLDQINAHPGPGPETLKIKGHVELLLTTAPKQEEPAL